MKIFVSFLFGLFMPIVVFWIVSLVTRLNGGSGSSMPLPKDFYLYSYLIMFIVFTAIEYYSLTKKEQRKEAEEEEQQKRAELEEKMRQYLEKKMKEEANHGKE